MTEVRCTVCGEKSVLRSQFEVEGECPECEAEPGSLVVLDAYDDSDITTLQCAECGWTVEAGVDVTWDEDERQIFSVDDDCPMCDAAGYPGEPLEPADQVRQVRDMPEYKVARAAAAKLRHDNDQVGIPIDIDRIAASLGLEVRRGHYPHHGMLRDTVIEVPEGHRGAERFVISHEIGHHCLRHRDGDRHKLEPEANAFGSELLIPSELLRRELQAPRTITALSRRFDASRQAVVYAVRAARLLDRLTR